MLYLGLGLSVAIVAGWVIGRLKMERHLEDWVRMPSMGDAGTRRKALDWRARAARVAAVREIVGKVWPYMLAGIAVGARHPRLCAAGLHGLHHGQGRLVVGAGWRC